MLGLRHYDTEVQSTGVELLLEILMAWMKKKSTPVPLVFQCFIPAQ